mmetsp:Transcript_36659/g.119257  ORF Transcript_36659/g.119257 Transcript_36659/m.119257 type:complete len:922 (+) Transcript_36659:43-2808(+)
MQISLLIAAVAAVAAEPPWYQKTWYPYLFDCSDSADWRDQYDSACSAHSANECDVETRSACPQTCGLCTPSSPKMVIATPPIMAAAVAFLFIAYLYVRIDAFPTGAEVGLARVDELSLKIKSGARQFLETEYAYLAVFVVGLALTLFFLFYLTEDENAYTIALSVSLSFVTGATLSASAGWWGMMVATDGNAKTTAACAGDRANGVPGSLNAGLNVAFSTGAVMGFAVVGLGLAGVSTAYVVLCSIYGDDDQALVMQCLAGFGFGASSIALFARVAGGIYTKAADVGADLVGKVEAGIDEDDPHNPAVIADNVGDNVGDVAGMGSDLFGSFGEASCAALLVGASSPMIVAAGWGALMFPLALSGVGILVCMATSFVATDLMPVRDEKGIESALKMQLLVSTLLMTPCVYALAVTLLPAATCGMCVGGFVVGGVCSSPLKAFFCVGFGLWGGCVIGFVTEYYTSFSYTPVQEVANACRTGAATNIIYGLALGYKSAIVPVFVVAFIVFGAHSLAGFYGISLAALGMLATLATCLSIDVYGPVCDNAGGIAEMCELHPSVREKTDALDAAGNTTAAIGKGFAIGSACLVGLALFGAFVTRLSAEGGITTVDLLDPITFAGLLVGAMLPYWFSAMTMKSVGMAANAMVLEIKRQFDANPNLLIPNHPDRPDYDTCIKISTDASLQEMIAPGALVMLSPVLCGVCFGTRCVTGLLAGGIASGIQMAISSSNTGGAWDNAKKYIGKGGLNDLIARVEPDVVNELGDVKQKKSQIYKAAVTGDTVGDPLKDTSGPALNILMKLMAIISVVFAELFMAVNQGGGLIGPYVAAAPKVATAAELLLMNTVAMPAAAPAVVGSAVAGPTTIFAVFVGGALLGMGALAAGQRAAKPSASTIKSVSLTEPLLVARAAGIESTPFQGAARPAAC